MRILNFLNISLAAAAIIFSGIHHVQAQEDPGIMGLADKDSAQNTEDKSRKLFHFMGFSGLIL